MYVLLLKLSGPIISSGGSDFYDARGTSLHPRKSMVVGIIANALGRKRTDPIADIASMRFAVRTERIPDVCTDYQTIHSPEDLYVSPREYLTNPEFLCGFESEDKGFLETLLNVLDHPSRPLYAGRRCCVLDMPVGLGVEEGSLEDVLTEYPSKQSEKDRESYFICECRKDESPDEFAFDQPISFDDKDRKFGKRPIKYMAWKT